MTEENAESINACRLTTTNTRCFSRIERSRFAHQVQPAPASGYLLVLQRVLRLAVQAFRVPVDDFNIPAVALKAFEMGEISDRGAPSDFGRHDRALRGVPPET